MAIRRKCNQYSSMDKYERARAAGKMSTKFSRAPLLRRARPGTFLTLPAVRPAFAFSFLICARWELMRGPRRSLNRISPNYIFMSRLSPQSYSRPDCLLSVSQSAIEQSPARSHTRAGRTATLMHCSARSSLHSVVSLRLSGT